MRVHAYVLAADPSWVEESISSYYDLVDRIVVSYDRSGTSWTGTALPVEEALSRLAGVDPEGKMTLAPGDYSRTDWTHPMEGETDQRNRALAQAGLGADWVLQLDTDEVVADLGAFRSCLEDADRRGFDGLHYPARSLLQHVRGGLYAERSRKRWAVTSGYPGPVALRAGVPLTHARQAEADLFRVDVRPYNTDPAHPADTPVHRVVRKDQAILHYSMVRSEAVMAAKSQWSGHATDFDWARRLDRWHRLRDTPLRAVLATPRESRLGGLPARLAYLPDGPDREARRRNGLPT